MIHLEFRAYDNVIMWVVLFNQFAHLLGKNLNTLVNDIMSLFRMKTEMLALNLSVC